MSDTNPTSKERVTQIMDTIRRVAREQKSYRENTIRDLEDGANLLARLSVETSCFFTVEKCGHPLTCKCNAEEPTVPNAPREP